MILESEDGIRDAGKLSGEIAELEASYTTKAKEKGSLNSAVIAIKNDLASHCYELGVLCSNEDRHLDAVEHYYKAFELTRHEQSAEILFNPGINEMLTSDPVQAFPLEENDVIGEAIRSSIEGITDNQELFKLGLQLLSGHGVARNNVKALVYFEKAAEQQYAPEKYIIGLMYVTNRIERGSVEIQQEGTGAHIMQASNERWKSWEINNALGYYLPAAKQSYALAQTALGDIYKAGWPPMGAKEFSRLDAVRWYRLAIAQGDTQAKIAVDSMSYERRDMKKIRGLPILLLQNTLNWKILDLCEFCKFKYWGLEKSYKTEKFDGHYLEIMMNADSKEDVLNLLPDVRSKFISLMNRLMDSDNGSAEYNKFRICIKECIEARASKPSWFRRNEGTLFARGTNSDEYQELLDRINSTIVLNEETNTTISGVGDVTNVPTPTVAP